MLVSTEKTSAIVVRQADFSESSRVVTLFTRDFGKISVVAKGVKRLKSPFEAALDLLTVCNIVFIRKSTSGLDILTEAQLITRFKARERSLESLYAGYYVAELLAGLSEEYDPYPELFDEAVRTLQRFAGADPLIPAILRFELVLLREIGQLPQLDACVLCDAPSDSGAAFDFSVAAGGIICGSCQPEGAGRRIQSGTLAAARCLLSDAEGRWTRLVLSPQQLGELRGVLTATLSQTLGKRPRMLGYLKFS